MPNSTILTTSNLMVYLSTTNKYTIRLTFVKHFVKLRPSLSLIEGSKIVFIYILLNLLVCKTGFRLCNSVWIMDQKRESHLQGLFTKYSIFYTRWKVGWTVPHWQLHKQIFWGLIVFKYSISYCFINLFVCNVCCSRMSRSNSRTDALIISVSCKSQGQAFLFILSLVTKRHLLSSGNYFRSSFVWILSIGIRGAGLIYKASVSVSSVVNNVQNCIRSNFCWLNLAFATVF